MKRILAIAALAFTAFTAQAGTPTSVIDANGAVSYPTEPALSIERDTSAGNRTKIKYASGYQYMVDDASWSRYAAFKAGLTKPVDVPGNAAGLVYDTAKGFVGRQSSNGHSYVSWPNVGQAEFLIDGGAFATAAKAASN